MEPENNITNNVNNQKGIPSVSFLNELSSSQLTINDAHFCGNNTLGVVDMLDLVVTKLKQLDLYQVILFGSFAYGTANEDSDIDLLVVTADNFIPENYEEKSNLYLKVSRLFRDMDLPRSIDFIVYTKPMFERFIQLGSSFSREIMMKGQPIL